MFGLAQLLEQGDRFPLDATAELAPLPSPKKLHEVLVAVVQQLVQVNSSVGVFAKSSFFWAARRPWLQQLVLNQVPTSKYVRGDGASGPIVAAM